MNYDLIGIGNALVDIEVKVDDLFLEKYALNKGGMTLTSIADQKNLLQALSGSSMKTSSGGSAANTVHGISVLGGKAYYMGRVANDEYGHHYTEDMRNCHVGFAGPGSEEEGTGTCLILITPDTERTMLTHLGVSSVLHPDNVDETIVKNAKAVYIEGYLWTGEETKKSALKLAEFAKKDGIQVGFTLSDAFIVNSYKSSLRDFLNWNVDLLFCNDVEARAMCDTDDLEEAFDKLQSLVNTVFLTNGKQGSWVGKNGEDRIAIKPFTVNAVDTTGAGDLYAAGALYGLVNNHTLEESGILGSYCAAQVVTHFGGRMPVHAHTDAKEILKSYREL